jgi:predicted transcriptional regulator
MAVDESHLLEVLGTKYNPEILAVAKDPCSAKYLSETLDIPMATVYRRLEELEAAGLVSLTDRVLSNEHRRTKVYERQVDQVTVEFQDHEFDLSIVGHQIERSIDDLWNRYRNVNA